MVIFEKKMIRRGWMTVMWHSHQDEILKPYQFFYQWIDLLDWILRQFFEWKHLHVGGFHGNKIID